MITVLREGIYTVHSRRHCRRSSHTGPLLAPELLGLAQDGCCHPSRSYPRYLMHAAAPAEQLRLGAGHDLHVRPTFLLRAHDWRHPGSCPCLDVIDVQKPTTLALSLFFFSAFVVYINTPTILFLLDLCSIQPFKSILHHLAL